jgi:anaerobic dimethyl sulfoxide reductase subunit C
MVEWSLGIFTVAVQVACGLSLAVTLCGRGPAAANTGVHLISAAVFPVAALGLAASLFHLGRPIVAYRALLNLGRSPLSLEVLLSLVFALAALLSGYSRTRSAGSRSAATIVTSVAGVAALVSSFAVYLIPSQPAWNSGWLPVSFVAPVLMIGALHQWCGYP